MVLGVFGILTVAFGDSWDNSTLPTGAGRKDRISERRTPGWLTRPRHQRAEEELADAVRLHDAGRHRAAIRRYRTVVANWPDASEAVVAQQRLAEVREQRGALEKAFDEYQYLIRHYGGRFPYQPVIERQYAIVMRLAIEPRGMFRTLHSTQDVLEKLETLRNNAPTWERAPQLQAMIGKLHEKNGDYELAATAYAALQRRYPQTPEAQAAAFREVRCMVLLTRKHPTDEAWIRETHTMLRRYLAHAPAGNDRNRAEGFLQELENCLIALWEDRAHFYDHLLNRPQAALIVYQEWLRHFPTMPQADSIRERMETLQTKMERQ